MTRMLLIYRLFQCTTFNAEHAEHAENRRAENGDPTASRSDAHGLLRRPPFESPAISAQLCGAALNVVSLSSVSQFPYAHGLRMCARSWLFSMHSYSSTRAPFGVRRVAPVTHGFVSAFGSVTVASYASVPSAFRVNRSTTCMSSEWTVPTPPSHVLSLKPTTSTTSESPSHFAT